LRHDPLLAVPVEKAEPREKGSNPRVVVTSLAAEAWPAQAWYEKLSGARGAMGNRSKQQRRLFSDRTRTAFPPEKSLPTTPFIFRVTNPG